MLRRLALAPTLLLALGTAPFFADDPPASAEAPKKAPVVATLDMDKLLKQAKLAQQLETRLKGLEESIRAQLAPMESQLNQKKANFESNQDAFTPEQRTLEAQGIQKMEQQFQMAQRQAQEAYTRQRDSLAGQWRQALDPVVDAVAKERGWDMIFTRPGADLLWSAEWLDASALVIERLNTQFDEAAAAQAAAENNSAEKKEPAPAPAAPPKKKK